MSKFSMMIVYDNLVKGDNMKKVNKFSVLMSVYFKESPINLDLAINSIVTQTLKPDEFIIVEDGPLTPELECCIKKYCEIYKYIKVIRLPKNVGLGKALNHGLKFCSYDYVARMDSDDISVKDRFEKQLSFLSKNMEYDVIGGNIMEFDSISGLDLSQRVVPGTEKEINQFLKKRNPMNHVSVIFRKSSVIESGGYIDCPYFEDYYLWARMIAKGKRFINMNEILVRVRAGLDMSGRRGSFRYLKSIVNFQKKLLNLKIINVFTYLTNIFLRSMVALFPNKLRYSIYQLKLRKR